MQDPIEQVTGNVVNAVKDNAGGFFQRMLSAPFKFIGSAIGGLFSGALWFGLPLFALQAIAPNLAGSLVRGVAQLLNKPELEEQFAALGTRPDGSQSIIPRLLLSLGIGATAGAVVDGTKGVLASDNQQGGGLPIGGLVFAAAAVGIGAILVKNGTIKLPGGDDAANSPATTPDASVAAGQQKH
jgi:hypothetical protein